MEKMEKINKIKINNKVHAHNIECDENREIQPTSNSDR